MGADEKHAATYHGGQYTPTRAQIGQALECAYIESSELEEVLDNIQAMLAKVRAEAKAEALNEVANAFQYKAWNELIQGSLQDRLRVAQPITAWLRARANQYKEEPADGR